MFAGRLRGVLKLKIVSRKAKLRVHTIIIRPTVTSICETWTITRRFRKQTADIGEKHF